MDVVVADDADDDAAIVASFIIGGCGCRFVPDGRRIDALMPFTFGSTILRRDDGGGESALVVRDVVDGARHAVVACETSTAADRADREPASVDDIA